MTKCNHDFKKNGDYCQWERTIDKRTIKFFQYISCCTKCGDMNESEPEIVN